jgi:hypothetical protein
VYKNSPEIDLTYLPSTFYLPHTFLGFPRSRGSKFVTRRERRERMNRILSLATTTTNRVVNSSLILLQHQSRVPHFLSLLQRQSRVLFGTSTTPSTSSSLTIEKVGNDVFSIANVPQTPRFKLYKSSTMPPLVVGIHSLLLFISLSFFFPFSHPSPSSFFLLPPISIQLSRRLSRFLVVTNVVASG